MYRFFLACFHRESWLSCRLFAVNKFSEKSIVGSLFRVALLYFCSFSLLVFRCNLAHDSVAPQDSNGRLLSTQFRGLKGEYDKSRFRSTTFGVNYYANIFISLPIFVFEWNNIYSYLIFADFIILRN